MCCVQLNYHRAHPLVELISGHLGCGQWQFKILNQIPVLLHVQPFNRFDRFCIGPDQILDYQVESTTGKISQVNIQLTDDRYCIAHMPTSDLTYLDDMKQGSQPAPIMTHSKHSMVISLVVFCVISILMLSLS